MMKRLVGVVACLWLGACIAVVESPPTDAGSGGAAAGGDATGGGSVGGGDAVGGGGTEEDDAGQPDASMETPDAGPIDSGVVDAGMPILPCQIFDAGNPQPTGTTRTLMTGQALHTVLAMSAAGDRVLIPAGTWPLDTISSTFTGNVFVEAVPGARPSLTGLTLNSAKNLVFKGLRFTDTVTLNRVDGIRFDDIDADLGAQDKSVIKISNSSKNVAVVSSRIAGGARTIFISGAFAPSDTWNSNMVFVNNDLVCGTHNCFQFSGGRDTVIDNNYFHNAQGDGVLTAGATRITITRNKMVGTKTLTQWAGVRLASPGTEWDNYAGVQNMITSDITVANNLMMSWGLAGIELDAARDIRIVNNTILDGVGLRTRHRTPHDQQGNVIIEGNSNYRVWNNIVSSISVDTADPMPMAMSNLVGTNTQFQNTTDYPPVSPGPAIDTATMNSDTPLIDRRGRQRGSSPDIGAFEVGAPVCQ